MDRTAGSLPSRTVGNHRVELCSEPTGARLAFYDFFDSTVHRPGGFGAEARPPWGFLIGLPALEKLRATFATTTSRWSAAPGTRQRGGNLASLMRSGTYDYFPENSQNWNGEEVESLERFREVCNGRFDIAIDLRVDRIPVRCSTRRCRAPLWHSVHARGIHI